MKTIKIKHSLASGGRCTLASPCAVLGWHYGMFVGEIHNVPDEVPANKAVLLYNQTTFWPWKTVCDYAELGNGRIHINKSGLPPTMTVTEVAEHLGITADRVRKLIAANRLPAQKRGRDWVISALDLPLVEKRKPGRPREVDPEWA